VIFPDFYGNHAAGEALRQMIAQGRIPQTLLFSGPEGVGKATLARRFAAELLGEAQKIEADDLSRPENQEIIAEREKWPSEKRVEQPLLFGSHPDFLTFPPDGPLRQITIQQIRTLKERAQYGPLRGKRRVFLIDHADRANEQAANSLLKILEEPPEYLVLVMTAENPYDLLPTIRSRSVPLYFSRLGPEEMQRFAVARDLEELPRRLALAFGSPGVALSLDLAAYDKRRAAMLVLLQVAAGVLPFGTWLKYGDTIGASRSEKLEHYVKVLYLLLQDLVTLSEGGASIRNSDVKKELGLIANAVSFEWLVKATARLDELAEMLRRNIQKSIALDSFAVEMTQCVQ
jgi:DNA polymerase-3 subunit delta'